MTTIARHFLNFLRFIGLSLLLQLAQLLSLFGMSYIGQLLLQNEQRPNVFSEFLAWMPLSALFTLLFFLPFNLFYVLCLWLRLKFSLRLSFLLLSIGLPLVFLWIILEEDTQMLLLLLFSASLPILAMERRLPFFQAIFKAE